MDIFNGIFESSAQASIELTDFLACMGTALLIGAFLAAVYTHKTRYTKSFLVTLGILPAVVCMVIMMVNGNVGAGVAVAGAFSLVRFRSVPGSAKEIAAIFLAMGSGLVVGMGYLGYAVLFALILGCIMFLYSHFNFGNPSKKGIRTLKITIPEDLNYTTVFDDVFQRYTSDIELVSVKTTNLGSLFKLTYDVSLKDISREKEFIDELRIRNGNLEISIFRQETISYEL